MKGLLLSLFCWIGCFLHSQSVQDSLVLKDTLFLMNGEILATRILDTLPETVYCVHPQPTKKQPDRKLLMDKERLFSIKYANGTERLMYKYDTMAGNFFTIPEMRNFVNGEQDAGKYARSRPEFWTGVGIGFVSGAILPHYGGYFYSYIPSFAYTGILLLPIIKVKAPNYKVRGNPHYDVYLLGYERVARKKKIVSGLKGSAIGLAAGTLLFFLVPDSFYQENL